MVFLGGYGGNGGQVCSGSAILNFGVGDGSVFLPQMQSQLTLVTEVQVTILTLKTENYFFSHFPIYKNVKPSHPKNCDSHDKVSLPCVFVSDS